MFHCASLRVEKMSAIRSHHLPSPGKYARGSRLGTGRDQKSTGKRDLSYPPLYLSQCFKHITPRINKEINTGFFVLFNLIFWIAG